MSFEDKKAFAEALNFNSIAYQVGWQTAQAGKSLHGFGAVELLQWTDTSADCIVSDGNHEHRVSMHLMDQSVDYDCNCKQGMNGRICRHVVAAAITINKKLMDEIKNSWQNKLVNLQYGTRQSIPTPKKVPGYWLIFALMNEYYNWSIHPMIAPVDRLEAGESEQERWSSEQVAAHLANNPALMQQFRSTTPNALSVDACLNAPAHIVSMAKILLKSARPGYYSSSSLTDPLPGVIEILMEAGVPLYRAELNYRSSIIIANQPLEILPDPAQILLDIEDRKDGGLRLQFYLQQGGRLWNIDKQPVVICLDPTWLLLKNQLIQLMDGTDPVSIDSISKASKVVVPVEEKALFMETYLPRLASRFIITGGSIHSVDINETPKSRLYLEDKQGLLEVGLRFGYGAYEVAYEARTPAVTSEYDPASSTFTRIYRDVAQEQEAFSQVSSFGLKRASGQPGIFNLRARVDVVDFLMRYVPAAVKAGFEVYGEGNIKNVRVNRNQPKISFSISSGIDWFDLQAVVNYGDLAVPLKEIRRALRRKENYIKLADGTIGEVPQEWVERYKHLFGLGEETDQGMRFSSSQVTLLDQLLEEAEGVQTDQEFLARSKRLKEFGQINEHPLPHGLTGELRPYQKAGMDWLHFLHEYQFGGCLADDMGLGKTIQVLAFLQSLKENHSSSHPTLIVVPRSLLVNWQREVEKFTPELRLLEYHGLQRSKDPGIFDQYDLVATTYGIVIRDIELLRKYRFHYAVLDESQAIKNPLAKTSKACRLLQSDHRLVMTGTPVENSTFELWSQFAFLNPGLLGSLDYYKDQIAGPIERDSSADTAQLLRRMIYPFILRRTKEQVAPELPPRTERIVFGEMDTAQRKLYLRTREEYRRSLMGLIEGQGLENARMKILEGLLRLRQLCIHPRLIDKTYSGESAKFELLLEAIDNIRAEGHKALIFSQFVETLKLLRKELDEQQIHYTYLDGSTINRQEQVDRFQNDASIPFFLISLKAGGVGLNLTAADYVIHIDPWWNPAVEMQASDRTHRIGQDKPVFIYKYILRETIEEKILLLQEKKKNLVEQLITTESSFFKSLTPEDVKGLFS